MTQAQDAFNAAAELGLPTFDKKYVDVVIRGIKETTDNPSAAGNNTEVQFNDNGVLAGDANFTFDKTTTALSGGAFVPTGNTAPTNGLYLPSANNVAVATSGTGHFFIDSTGNITQEASSPDLILKDSQSHTTTDGPTLQFQGRGPNATNYNFGFIRGVSSGVNNAGKLELGTNSAGVQGAAITILPGGNVGVGTSSPYQELTLRGTNEQLLFDLNTATNGQYASIAWNGSTADLGTGDYSAEIRGYREASGAYGALGFHTRGASGNSQERLHITSAGNVGIGSTNPTQLLTVEHEADNDGIRLYNRVFATGSRSRIGFNALNSYSSSSVNAAIDAVLVSNGNTATELTFSTAGNNNLNSAGLYERARIDSSGRLLVGTPTAIATYDYNGASYTPYGQLAGNTFDKASLSITRTSGGSAQIFIGAGSSGNDVTSDNRLSGVHFSGFHTSKYYVGASIEAYTENTTLGDGDLPTRLVFSTCASGSSSPTVRLTLNRVGDAAFSNTSAVYPTTDNAATLGGSSNRWSAVWAANGTIQTSDERAKADIANAQLGSNFIKSLRPVSYRWIEGGKRDTGERDEDGNYIYESVPGQRTHWGFIAQEVKQVADEAGVDFGGWVLTDKDDPDSQQALRYDQFIAPLTKALQETMAELEALKAEVAALKAS